MTEVQGDLKQYQWKKGEDFGSIVDVESEEGEFVTFTNGQRIFKSVLSEFLEPVINGEIPFPGANPLTPVKKEKVNITTPPVVSQGPTEVEPSVLGKMILKMSKKNVVNVPIQINLNIPTPQLYSMLGEGMETEDLNQEISEVAMSQIEINKLQEYIKANVTDFLSEYYS